MLRRRWVLLVCLMAFSPCPLFPTSQAMRIVGEALSLPSTTYASIGDTPVPTNMTYWGGKIVTEMQAVVVLWGTGTYIPELQSNSTENNIVGYIDALLNSTWAKVGGLLLMRKTCLI